MSRESTHCPLTGLHWCARRLLSARISAIRYAMPMVPCWSNLLTGSQSRPHGVSQHWASALSEEWSSQVQLEEHFHLPSTVKPSTNPLAQAKSQIFFITNFAKPLLDLTAKAIPRKFSLSIHPYHSNSKSQSWTILQSNALLIFKPGKLAHRRWWLPLMKLHQMFHRSCSYNQAYRRTFSRHFPWHYPFTWWLQTF